ncbi:MAG TPA: hypothetical protein VGW74_02425 [Propionibacteriaceae bacterium]|nr:hypothetical protein [Propionibacteriaceae bacterium]
MTPAETDRLIRQLIGGDPYAPAAILRIADQRRSGPARGRGPDRAIAAAYGAGDDDRVDALARDHLVDHPDHLLVAWIAAGAGRQSLSDPTTHHQETT